ncbi:hypothetical protein V8G54_000859 [Vigna mungo]|uniref:HMA domain-containing protein n=1 Tax=Vigna mungo TaxID=3915 RepID=A0AAQ3P764_VIGMU
MAFLRSVATTATAVAAIPAAFAFSCLSSSPSSSSSSSSSFSRSSDRFGLLKTLATPPSVLHMDHKLSSQPDAVLPELLTEYMVDMKCEGCVNAVKNKLHEINGVKNVEVDLSNQIVRILGSTPVKTMTEALEQTGRKARLIGQGIPEVPKTNFTGWDFFKVKNNELLGDQFVPKHTFTMAVVLVILETRLLPEGNLLEGEGRIFGSTGRDFHDLDRGDASTSPSCECFNQGLPVAELPFPILK